MPHWPFPFPIAQLPSCQFAWPILNRNLWLSLHTLVVCCFLSFCCHICNRRVTFSYSHSYTLYSRSVECTTDQMIDINSVACNSINLLFIYRIICALSRCNVKPNEYFVFISSISLYLRKNLNWIKLSITTR